MYHVKWDLTRAKERLVIEATHVRAERERRERELDAALMSLSDQDYEGMERELTPIDQRSFVKFSPTDARPEVYEYTLVSVSRFAAAVNESSLAGIFSRLAVTSPDAVNAGNIRCEPSRRDAANPLLPPGLVWFSLKSWRECPSIGARNADVMAWIDAKVEDMRTADTVKSVSCGQAPKASWARMTLDAVMPFVAEPSAPEHDTLGYPTALVGGLKRVTLHPAFDLAEVRPYSASLIETVAVRRVNNVLIVWTADGTSQLGLLRPVQRYVLRKGLERVTRLGDIFRRFTPAVDPLRVAGYVRLGLEGGSFLSHLPPIIETVEEDEIEEPGRQEFLVCDGTHRILQHCWFDTHELLATLVRQPSVPYYAHPCSTHDWSLIAARILSVTPSPECKYTARTVSGRASGHYRRYFRDFNSAFTFVGGQGERAA